MSDKKEYLQPIKDLRALLNDDPSLKEALKKSLKMAVDTAEEKLNPDLYSAINRVFKGNGWPKSIPNYMDYLRLYVRLVPNEENDPCYPLAWKSTDDKNGYNQKVYDLLCQFYWLVNQPINEKGETMQSFEKFAEWLIGFAKAWGAFCDTKASITHETLMSFKHNPGYNFELYADHEDTWDTFNKFFFREFNQANPVTGITPLRPIADPENNQTIVSPADCTYKKAYPIDDQGNVTEVVLKHTHTIGTIHDLLKGSEYEKDFYGGTFVHYFLGPFDYHRFHSPVKGKVKEIRAIHEKVYLDVIMQEDGQWDAPDGAGNGYEFHQARGLIIVDAGPVVGKIAVLPIGMAQVSGVDMYTDKIKTGDHIVKGQEFGKFKFGGSDIIVLFQKAPDLYLFEKDPGRNPIHFQYGQTIAYWNEQNELK